MFKNYTENCQGIFKKNFFFSNFLKLANEFVSWNFEFFFLENFWDIILENFIEFHFGKLLLFVIFIQKLRYYWV